MDNKLLFESNLFFRTLYVLLLKTIRTDHTLAAASIYTAQLLFVHATSSQGTPALDRQRKAFQSSALLSAQKMGGYKTKTAIATAPPCRCASLCGTEALSNPFSFSPIPMKNFVLITTPKAHALFGYVHVGRASSFGLGVLYPDTPSAVVRWSLFLQRPSHTKQTRHQCRHRSYPWLRTIAGNARRVEPADRDVLVDVQVTRRIEG